MKKFIFVILFGLAVSLVFAQTNNTSRKRYALVIGNQQYADYPLTTNEADAAAVASALESKEFEVTLKKNLTGAEFREALDSFITKVNGNTHSVALFYFTGHAFTEAEKNYLLPVDNNRFHSAAAAKEAGFDIQSDVADKIKTVAQIYIVDGAYENPFKSEGTRAIGIKGGLSAAKAARESTVGFLFSAAPNNTVLTPTGKTSAFANAVVSEINYGKSDLSTTFNNIKHHVSSATKNEQVPYSSATSLDFAFNGDELTALKKQRAIADADTTSLASYALNKSFEAQQTELNIQKSNLSAQTEAELLRLSQEAKEQRLRLQEEDRLRRLEEEQLAQERSAAANFMIDELRREFESNAAVLSSSLKKDSTVEDRIGYIESMKSNLKEIRNLADEQVADFNSQIDEETADKVEDIWKEPLKITEKDSSGNMTETAKKRRYNKEAEIRTEASRKKNSYEETKRKQVDQDNRKWLPQIKTAYDRLEGSTYSITSLSDALTVRVGNYDGQTGTWPLHITSELFGYTSLFEEKIDLSYTEVTGEKNIDISKMSDAQMERYSDNVVIYDSLFRSATPVFYVKLSFKVMRWKEASEYHFVPVKCEVVRLGKKNKTIHTVKQSDMDSKEFFIYPTVEIRSWAERTSDIERANKIREAEEKTKPKPVVSAAAPSFSYDYDSSVSSYDSYTAKVEEPKKAKEKKESDSRRGRNTFYVSGELGTTDILGCGMFKDDIWLKEDPMTVSGELHLTFNYNSFIFWGVSGGIQKWDFADLAAPEGTEIRKVQDENVKYGKYVNGIALNLGSHIRPYVLCGISYYNDVFNPFIGEKDKLIGLNAGAGLDIILGSNFMLTFGADYGWMHYLDSFKNGVFVVDRENMELKTGFMDVLKNPDYHHLQYSIGLGFTW